ncbi:hypothetical protein L6164_013261 [Bauhinia variegata]|uniref:Uncharacterized protein n=1 Tax=Bauhinia variegata TaxID=167791 RepID=A0ACB9PE06_BAUVA|nr:hypothetical protein L6164_013261 [Bauhinia variegata]
MSGYRRNFRPRRYWDEDYEPVHYNESIGSFNNTGSGQQNVSGLKNTGYMAGDGNGSHNRNHFGDVMNNNGYVNSGTQNIGVLSTTLVVLMVMATEPWSLVALIAQRILSGFKVRSDIEIGARALIKL